jgi:hypothetical protein
MALSFWLADWPVHLDEPWLKAQVAGIEKRARRSDASSYDALA